MFISYHRKTALAATITVSVLAVSVLAASVLGTAGADTGAAVAGEAELRLLVADDYIDARLLLPANLIPESLHGADPKVGSAAQPPYVTLLQQADGFIMFPVESKCHSDGASILRVARGTDPDGVPIEDPAAPPPAPPAGTALSGSYQFHCDALTRAGLEWIGFELFESLPLLRGVEVTVLETNPPLRTRLTREQRRLRLRLGKQGNVID